MVVTTMLYDADTSRRVEATYTTPDVIEQRRQVLGTLALQPGERVLDIGSGPGFLAVEMAAAVGPAGEVQGVDVSGSMLVLAEAREVSAGSAPVTFRRGGAEQLPVPNASFDVAVSTQVLEYVEDVPGALAEIHRVLRPGGRVLLLDTDWDSIVWHSEDDERMARVLVAWEEHLVDPHLPRTLGASLEAAGFDVAAPWVLPLLNTGYAPDTYSVGLLDIVAAFVSGRAGVSAEDVDAWAEDLRTLGTGYFFSLNRYVFCATKPA
ncbi:MAG TPA: methyltransferase domain-containing protein [Pseudonocardiaceae bacterium]|nr:methyltransferase domain-containing protein [Pseudonocardiaceae bacterium]